jgi:flagellar biosynthesis protein FlhF
MKIKSYFARTVEDAMARASQEMGPEAMLVNSRRAPVEARHLGEYEVAFATEVPEGAVPAPHSPHATAEPAPAADRLSLEVSGLKRELEGMRRVLTRSAFAPSQWSAAPPAVSEAYSLLAASDISPELAREIVQAAEERTGGTRPVLARLQARAEPARFQKALIEEMESRIQVQPALGRSDARPRTTALIGPPGSGKTTTLVKLAVNYGLASRRPVLLLSMDTYRVAAAEQLRSYAAILGVGFQVTETLAALAQTIEENRGKDLILIDTPGLGFADMDTAGDLARFLSTRGDIDTQLVLPASMKPADLGRVVDSYECFRPQRLLFTKLDETGTFGPVFGEAARTGKPLSFFATGQRIPEDLEEARSGRLLELVLSGEGARGRTAA